MNLSEDFQQKCRALIAELQLGAPEDITSIDALDGGVSSDIALVQLKDRKLCIKAALPQLKVAAQWNAPTHRNETEYRWLSWVASFLPEAVPKLFGHSDKLSSFAMDYLNPAQYRNWKKDLLAGKVVAHTAEQLGTQLVIIHSRSRWPEFDPSRFQQKDDFYALRLEPYLQYTAQRHPAVALQLQSLARQCHQAQIALVHGDISPKNILVGPHGPVILDAECAVMGDPAFDIAFCLNHFLLKAVHLPEHRDALLDLVSTFWNAYAFGVRWEPVRELETRVAALLPALFLARVDGKSPAEYLSAEQAAQVRALALPLIKNPIPRLTALLLSLRNDLRKTKDPT